jgi:hypothetical protein
LRRAFDATSPSSGDVSVDAVAACVMFKRSRTFAEVRQARLPRAGLPAVEHPRIGKTLRLSAHRTAHFVDIARATDVDRDVRDWLAEAYACSPI